MKPRVHSAVILSAKRGDLYANKSPTPAPNAYHPKEKLYRPTTQGVQGQMQGCLLPLLSTDHTTPIGILQVQHTMLSDCGQPNTSP